MITTTKRFSKILVALDRSEAAEGVFSQALALAQQNNSSMLLLHTLLFESDVSVITGLGMGLSPELGAFQTLQLRQETLQEELADASAWLKILCAKADAAAVPADFECKLGEPSAIICDRAQSWGADLIVVGRRGRRGIAEVFLGSVSNYVLHHASCSVLVVQ